MVHGNLAFFSLSTLQKILCIDYQLTYTKYKVEIIQNNPKNQVLFRPLIQLLQYLGIFLIYFSNEKRQNFKDCSHSCFLKKCIHINLIYACKIMKYAHKSIVNQKKYIRTISHYSKYIFHFSYILVRFSRSYI